MDKQELLAESVADKFQRYVRFDTQSREGAKSPPSTPGQRVLAELLCKELETIGVSARVDELGFLYASIPGDGAQAPPIGFLAHLDTSAAVSGAGVKPVLHPNYQGQEILLRGGVRLTVEGYPELAGLIGHDLITADGTTLLGADDKAGVAEIMVLACRMASGRLGPHGPVRIAFTPDEETGEGISHFDLEGFGAICAYTLDGGEAGELEQENFNAENLRVILRGVSSHPGSARGKMVNAIHAAADLVSGIPAGQRPETTDGYRGFMHPDSIEGNIEAVELRWLLRDFTLEGLEDKRRALRLALRHLASKYPGLRTSLRVTGGYRNMRELLAGDPRVVGNALAALERAGVPPLVRPIRGGTDGARLTFQGLPTPNLFTGGLYPHGRQELVSVQWMEQAVEVISELTKIWAGR